MSEEEMINMPSPYIIDGTSIKNTYNEGVAYDPRKLNLMTSVKDQCTLDVCWSFASLGTLESYLALNRDEYYDFSNINNWKNGRLKTSTGEFSTREEDDTKCFTSKLHLIPKYSQYKVIMESSNDRLLVVHRDEYMNVIGKVETKAKNGIVTISSNDRFIDFCYYKKGSSADEKYAALTEDEFKTFIEAGKLKLERFEGSSENFEILNTTIDNALVNLSNKIDECKFKEPEYFKNLNALQVNELISPAINLGNSLESWDNHEHSDWTPIDWETSWHNTVTTKDILKCYKDAGFRSIRVPVTWFIHMDDTGKINKDWLLRVKQIVDWCLELDMNVIINAHHDTNLGDYISATPANIDTSIAHLKNIWNQIGPYFAEYDYRVFFEGMNECVDLTLGDTDKWTGTPEAYEVVNKLNQAFVTTIRTQHGNLNRFLLVPTYGANALSAQTTAFKMPYDPTRNRLIVEMHNYSYTTKETLQLRESIKRNFTSKNIPIFIGEFGIGVDKIADSNERIEMNKYFIRTMRELGCSVCYWDASDYAILDRAKLMWKYNGFVEALILEANHYKTKDSN